MTSTFQKITLLKECQCNKKIYKCPYHDTKYDVYLWGTWDNWEKGIRGKIKKEKAVSSDEFHTTYYSAYILINLNIKTYEYKWQFIDKNSGEIFWLVDTTADIIENNGWNRNNLYIVSN